MIAVLSNKIISYLMPAHEQSKNEKVANFGINLFRPLHENENYLENGQSKTDKVASFGKYLFRYLQENEYYMVDDIKYGFKGRIVLEDAKFKRVTLDVLESRYAREWELYQSNLRVDLPNHPC